MVAKLMLLGAQAVISSLESRFELVGDVFCKQ